MIAMTASGDPSTQLRAAQDDRRLLGKRYVDAQQSVALLCIKGSKGSLAINGGTLVTKQTKALPLSD